AGVRVEMDPGPAPPPVLANRVQADQILSSVLAAEASSYDAASPDGVLRATAAVASERLVLTLSSALPPYTAEEVERLLNPFFLRNPETLGEGMSFAICARIAELHGGCFRLDTRNGARAYRLELPLAAPAPAVEAARPLRSGTEGLRVLLVDDDARVRESCNLMLRHLGHTVVSAASGEAALGHIATEAWDVVLLDLHLGGTGLDGRDVLHEIGKRRPDVLRRTFLATGDPTSATVRELERTLGVRVLAKPFGVDELRLALGAV
ncbi:MAG: response regulator, partial [Candidatus Binatia bacterium]